jgi:hypothetical protein
MSQRSATVCMHLIVRQIQQADYAVSIEQLGKCPHPPATGQAVSSPSNSSNHERVVTSVVWDVHPASPQAHIPICDIYCKAGAIEEGNKCSTGC